MFSLQSKLDSAMGVFNKAKKKLDAVIESCDKDDAAINAVEAKVQQIYEVATQGIVDQRTTVRSVRKNAQAYLKNINKIIGE